MNAYRHAGGVGQTVDAAIEDGELRIVVSDEGPGFDLAAMPAKPDGIGLRGLRERIESLGGEFEIDSAVGRGVRLRMSLPLGILSDVESDTGRRC